LYFEADDGVHGSELWVSDGTEAGTYMVLDFEPGQVGGEPEVLPCANEMAFFLIFRELGRADLFRSDGTASGTQYLNAYMPYYGDALGIDNILYFVGADPGNHYNDELWKSDGTIEGTLRVKDILPGPNGSGPWLFTEVNGLLYFSTGSGLWKSDGTDAGTILVGPGVHAFELANVNGKVFLEGTTIQGTPQTGNCG